MERAEKIEPSQFRCLPKHDFLELHVVLDTSYASGRNTNTLFFNIDAPNDTTDHAIGCPCALEDAVSMVIKPFYIPAPVGLPPPPATPSFLSEPPVEREPFEPERLAYVTFRNLSSQGIHVGEAERCHFICNVARDGSRYLLTPQIDKFRFFNPISSITRLELQISDGDNILQFPDHTFIPNWTIQTIIAGAATTLTPKADELVSMLQSADSEAHVLFSGFASNIPALDLHINRINGHVLQGGFLDTGGLIAPQLSPQVLTTHVDLAGLAITAQGSVTVREARIRLPVKFNCLTRKYTTFEQL